MHLRCVISWFQMCLVTDGRRMSTWISSATKQRFASAAARQGLSESALLKRLVEQMLASAPSDALGEAAAPLASRDARLTVRLVPEDRALLRERAAARTMHAATYVSVLVRSHLRRVAPLPDRELSSLQVAVRELAAIGRNLNTMARLLQQDARQAVPGWQEVQAMLRVCEALRDHFRALIKANLISWDVGHAEQNH
jgi:predicted DNA binding CopG/RHH family protein